CSPYPKTTLRAPAGSGPRVKCPRESVMVSRVSVRTVAPTSGRPVYAENTTPASWSVVSRCWADAWTEVKRKRGTRSVRLRGVIAHLTRGPFTIPLLCETPFRFTRQLPDRATDLPPNRLVSSLTD